MTLKSATCSLQHTPPNPINRDSHTPNSSESESLVEDVEDLSDESSVITAVQSEFTSDAETAEVVESGYESNSDVESVQSEFTSDAETAEVVESGYESNSDVESVQSEFTNDGEIIEVWMGDPDLTKEENFTPPSKRNKTTPNPAAFFQDIESGIGSDSDDWSMTSTNSFDSYNHRLSWSPDNATNNPELEVRLW
ncbi:hypothetical protein TrCOL_g10134 [Triparma columacea]|uniref:Uncharacterized protein n=1 Tax=Triparma columacea TaxID=722753 RepID=A0A9W7G2W3_9STRA|nr:hypothetical protein TrCOL_g10134 [Triparma columacea]